jgi:hypothetical protein
MIVGASVCDGVCTGHEIDEHFLGGVVVFIHRHNAKRNCSSCKVVHIWTQ